jgi:hypothetical protein
MVSQNFIIESMIFWALIGVIHAILYYYRYREREKEAAPAPRAAGRARLEALGAQLHPHFLFNTLQGISTLLHRDPDAADRMLARLSDLLRRTLRRAESQEVSLGDELETLDNYVAIQQVRFQDRLTVEKMIGPGAEEVLVPHFVLQPLVENAIEHGSRDARRRTNHDRGRQKRRSPRAERSDDGSGLDHSNDFPVEGIGLGNTRRRLAALYGDRAALTLSPAPGGGLRVDLVVPLRRTGMTAMRAVVVDDEPLARERIRSLPRGGPGGSSWSPSAATARRRSKPSRSTLQISSFSMSRCPRWTGSRCCSPSRLIPFPRLSLSPRTTNTPSRRSR